MAAVALVALAPCAVHSRVPGLDDGPVFPPAREAKSLGGQFVLDPKTFDFKLKGVGDSNSTARLRRSLARFHEHTFDYGPAADASTALCCGQTGTSSNCTCEPLTQLEISVLSGSDELTRFTNESYSLMVGEENGEIVSVLNATSIYGAMRGLQTFSQLVKFNLTSATYTVFGTQIMDSPRFEYRGVMVDTSRNFVSLAELRTVCDLMEQSKLNALSLHLTDTQSWPIEIDGFPKLTQWLSYGNHPYNTADNISVNHIFTIAEMQTTVQYCLDRAVRVIPEVDLPGHCPAQKAYPDYFVQTDNPHGCAANTSQTCGRGMIDITTEHGFEFVEGIYKSLIETFPGGEYHIGGDEVWMPPWSNSSAIQAWIEKYKDGCPDDPQIKCSSFGDLQPYFTRRTVEIIRKHRPDGTCAQPVLPSLCAHALQACADTLRHVLAAQIQGWNPGVGQFYGHGNLGTRYPYFTYNNWNGPGVWSKPMSDMTSTASSNASVILSGCVHPMQSFLLWRMLLLTFCDATDRPFYVYTGNPDQHEDWEQMMHTDILNFTGGDKSKVRGACLTAWGDAAAIDSGNTAQYLARFMSGFAVNMWSKNGTLQPRDPLPLNESHNSCNGDDYGICDTIDWHRCSNMMRGLPAGQRARSFGVECAVPYSPAAARTWWRSPKLPIPPRSDTVAKSDVDTSGSSKCTDEAEWVQLQLQLQKLRAQLRENGLVPTA